MALPLIAAGIAARAVAKKLATRAVAGITGAGAKQVAPINRNMGTGSVKVTNSPVSKLNQNIFNTGRDELVSINKSGQLARDIRNQKDFENSVGYIKKKTIKINSNPTRAR